MSRFSEKSRNSPKPVTKPYITGSAADENTLKASLIFFGSLVLTILMTFIVCGTTSGASALLRLIINTAVIAAVLAVFFSNGTNRGAEAVSRGEILYQKQERGKTFSKSEKAVCFHPFKGFIVGFLGTLPLWLPALLFAFTTQIQTTEAGSLPSWMQAYLRRSEISGALIQYTQAQPMGVNDILRIIIRISIMPFVNIAGSGNRQVMLLLERLSPLLLLLPALSYGTGYLTGRNVRTRIHTAIRENDRRRIRKEKKRIKTRSERERRPKAPQQLN